MKRSSSLMFLFTLLVLVLASCGPIPYLKMSSAERVADMHWVFSIYEQNYAPLKYKEQKFGFNFEDLKASYLVKAEAEQSNTEFFALMQSFVAEFKDAHNSGSFIPQNYKGYVQVAYLGFDGVRDGDGFYVERLLPTYTDPTGYPIYVGDIITKINGKSLKEAVDTEVSKYRNLGRNESNYTYLMRNLFMKSSLNYPMPGLTEVAELTVNRGGKEIQVPLIWVVQDRMDFLADQKRAVSQQTQGKMAFVYDAYTIDFNGSLKNRKVNGDFLQATMLKFYRETYNAEEYLKQLGLDVDFNVTKFDAAETFEVIPTAFNWSIVPSARAKDGSYIYSSNPFFDSKTPEPSFATSPVGKLKAARYLPQGDVIVLGPDDALRYPMYPAYIFSVDNEKKEKVKVGYIYLDTFSPADAMQAFLDFKETLSKFKAKGVKSIVIDTINNGGGSLGLGIALAQTLSKKKLELPGIQLRLSDSWLLEFREQADNPGYNPTVKRLKQMAYDSLEKDIADGRWLSSPLPIEALGDFTSWIDTYNSPGSETKIVVLVNEMCASMCDIFSAIMQDNKRAVIMGAQSMGAGGNVVNHSSSPRTNFQVRQTESLITRNNGSYIENNGTTPDIELVVNTDAKNKYSNIINKALAEAAKSNEVVIQPVPAPAPAEVAQN